MENIFDSLDLSKIDINRFDVDLKIEELDKEINNKEMELKSLKDYRDDLNNVKSISDKYNMSLHFIDKELEFYMKMEETICKNKKGREFWNSIKSTLDS